jgi:hypothetical protein
LGYNGIHEIKDHIWLKDIKWKELHEKKILSPFIPRHGDNFDKRYCEAKENIGNDTFERYKDYYKMEYFDSFFPKYTYMCELPRGESSRMPSAIKIKNELPKDPKKSPQVLSNSVLKSHKRILSYNSVNSNMSSTKPILKVLSQSPIPRKDVNKINQTPVLQSKQSVKSLLNAKSSSIKPIVRRRDSNVFDNTKLPYIESKCEKNSPYLVIYKKNVQNITSSFDTGSTNSNTTLKHKRTLSNIKIGIK